MRHWLTTADGGLDKGNLFALASVAIAIAGAVALIFGALYQVLMDREVQTGALIYMAGVCVAPLMGGTVVQGLKGRADSRTAAAIQSGEQPGRRASDSTEGPAA